MPYKFYRITLIVLSSFLLLSHPLATVDANFITEQNIQGTVLYVRADKNGNCTSWLDACDLVTAMYRAEPGDQVWVAAGVYKPTTTTNRTYTFNLESGVSIYGGFPSTGGDWYTRDLQQNNTILSGEIGDPSSRSDNSYHVVSANNVDETAILDGFRITSGYASTNRYGGGIYIKNSSPQLNNLVIENNYAEYGGGAYFSYSRSILNNVTVTNNQSNIDGGGFWIERSNVQINGSNFVENKTQSDGGAIYVNMYGEIEVNNSSFNNNFGFFGGAISGRTFSKISISGSDFYNNYANHGGAFFTELGSGSIINSVFNQNKSVQGGGALELNQSRYTIKNSGFRHNEAKSNGGAIIISTNCAVDIDNVQIANNNSGGNGGGIWTNQDINVTNAEIENNSANVGGGIYSNSTFRLQNSLVHANQAVESGGGISSSGSSNFSNVTISQNIAGTKGGGIYQRSGDNPSYLNVTIYNNYAEVGGGIYNATNLTTIVNAVLWGNTPNEISDETNTVAITYSTIQYGMVGEGNISTDPELLALNNNGGGTKTHALMIGSPAIDKGSPSVCPTTDQRGIIRPYDGDGNGDPKCDMGAYEWQKANLQINTSGNGSFNIQPMKPYYISGEKVTLTAIPDLGWIFSGWTGDMTSLKNPAEVIVVGDMIITANFVQITDNLYFPTIIRK